MYNDRTKSKILVLLRDFNKKVFLERVLRYGCTYLASSSIRTTKLVF